LSDDTKIAYKTKIPMEKPKFSVKMTEISELFIF